MIFVSGLIADQRFYLSNAQTWCSSATQETWRSLATNDRHAVAAPGVNGTILNLPEFAEAFGCQVGDAMVQSAEEVCQLW